MLLLCLCAICAAVLGVFAWLRADRSSVSFLLSRLPSDDAIVLYLDFAALRKASVLSLIGGPGIAQEPEYRAFVEQTAFDYTRDLDAALVSFHKDGTYFLLRGRFYWKTISDYVTRQGGECYNAFCRVQGSTPDRKISLFPLSRDVLAMAVSKDVSAAIRLQAKRGALKIQPVDRPVWAVIPSTRLKAAQALPSGTRMFARLLERADRIQLSMAPDGSRMAMYLDVTCRTPQDATLLAEDLRGATRKLGDLIALERQTPNPSDLSGLLTAGSFESRDVHVLGRWPVEKAFLQALGDNSL